MNVKCCPPVLLVSFFFAIIDFKITIDIRAWHRYTRMQNTYVLLHVLYVVYVSLLLYVQTLLDGSKNAGDDGRYISGLNTFGV